MTLLNIETKEKGSFVVKSLLYSHVGSLPMLEASISMQLYSTTAIIKLIGITIIKFHKDCCASSLSYLFYLPFIS